MIAESTNDGFGQINDVVGYDCVECFGAQSRTEHLAIDEASVKNDVAQCLLSRVLRPTVFQQKCTQNGVLPQLIERGANRNKVVKYLYKTQPLGLIKLWVGYGETAMG